MISLSVEPYCEECKEFSPEAHTIFANDKPITVVTCIWADKCERIAAKIREQTNAEKGADNDA